MPKTAGIQRFLLAGYLMYTCLGIVLFSEDLISFNQGKGRSGFAK